jgi:hypothetical protein
VYDFFHPGYDFSHAELFWGVGKDFNEMSQVLEVFGVASKKGHS